MAKLLPKISEIERAKNELRSLSISRMLVFSDMLKRLVDVELGTEHNWLEFHAIAFIVYWGNGVLTPGELAKLMIRSRHGITVIIDRCEKAGYVKRYYANTDRRTVQIKVTSLGLEFMLSTLSKKLALIEGRIRALLSEDEIKTLLDTMWKIRKDVIMPSFLQTK